MMLPWLDGKALNILMAAFAMLAHSKVHLASTRSFDAFPAAQRPGRQVGEVVKKVLSPSNLVGRDGGPPENDASDQQSE